MKDDAFFMAEAVAEARRATGLTSPNPLVGALVVRGSKVVGRGHHKKAGLAHAEVIALDEAGKFSKGATLYTSLEPCVHEGRTGPCTKTIIDAGIRRVVIGTTDPNPKVKNKGIRALRKAGLDVTTGVLEEECRALNKAYNFSIVHRRPWILLKAATSLDGRIATRTGQSKWITSKQARARGREFRSELDAICVGISTVLADDPQLTCRQRGKRNPVRIILDSTLRIPMSSQLVRTAKKVPTIVATTRKADKSKQLELEQAGVRVLVIRQDRGRVDLNQCLAKLYDLGIMSILVEGGAQTHGSFVDAGLVDSVAMFLAPILIGGENSKSGIGGRGVAKLNEALTLEPPRIENLGRDILLLADVRRK